jgi:hypothetical protein
MSRPLRRDRTAQGFSMRFVDGLDPDDEHCAPLTARCERIPVVLLRWRAFPRAPSVRLV